MKVSLRWLSDYVDVSGYTARELAEIYTRGGIEIDAIEERNLGVSGVVVGYVKTREKHPDADKLSVCTVDVGQGEELQIVCGAPNVAAGQKVPVAVVGAVLPGDFKIKKAKLRGVESQGMICSAKELGMNDKLLPKEIQEGILVLPEGTDIGAIMTDVLALDDQVLELDLTPNRSDCLSMRGAAYELGALLDRKSSMPPVRLSEEVGGNAEEMFRITIGSPEHCDLYAGRVIEGVKVAPSPIWLQNRLMATGVRPINNIVDVTNYVMLEYGQPLHAFDADLLSGSRIDVRTAREGETIVTLDNAERKLEPHMLLITDADKPVAIAGVMGGANSEVSEGTRRIFLESARFSGQSVRRTSKQLGLRSEASLRFEKEVDPEAVIPALDRAAALIAELSGGRVVRGITQASPATPGRTIIEIGTKRVNRFLGTSISMDELMRIFDRLAFDYERSGDLLHVIVPSRRGDITRDVDLIEEVARLHGYDHIPTTLLEGVTTPGALNRPQFIRRAIRRALTQGGMHEAISYSFTEPGRAASYTRLNSEASPIQLAMPMSEERSVLRTSLVPHLIDIAAMNASRNNDNVAIFELGSVFVSASSALTELPAEQARLGILLTGGANPTSWASKGNPADFYDLKGQIERLAANLGLPDIDWKRAQTDGLHPGRSADLYIGEQLLGYAGQLHPSVQNDHDLLDTFIAELDLAVIYELSDFKVEFRSLPRFPAITRDIALVVDRGVDAALLVGGVRESGGVLLESVELFDVYSGDRIESGKKSVALSLVYRHAERTLTDDEVAVLHESIVDRLRETFGAELRK